MEQEEETEAAPWRLRGDPDGIWTATQTSSEQELGPVDGRPYAFRAFDFACDIEIEK
jgi:hypothetical protein